MAESIIGGALLGAKRGLLKAIGHGVTSRGLARRLLSSVFDKVLGAEQDGEFRDRGGQLARGVERVPLAEGETLLRSAINRVLGEDDSADGLRAGAARMIRRSALGLVEKYTLANLRERGATAGGIDLVLLRGELEPKIDAIICEKLTGSLRLWMLLGIIGLPVVVFLDYYMVTAVLGH